MQIQREGLHLRILAILARLAECNARTGAYAKALRPALRYLELEPWSEENLRRVMRLYSINGQIDAALTCYRASALALKRELGVLPSAETVALAEKIERGELVIEAGSDAQNAAASHGTGQTTVGASERRQVTVLFCEMSAPAAEDPDELMALMAAPQSQCLAIIREHQGYVAQTHGGGLLAYFGFPRAAENAAQQAVQTALQLVGQAYAGLELRVGVHSGMVISGDAQLPDAIGAASGLAIRLRQVVDGGEVAISGATQRLVEGFFECDFLGSRKLRGIAKSVDVFRVTRENGARGRLEARAVWTPLVGRQLELEKLRSLWQATRSGNGRVVVLTGEPGVGKSRLIKAFKQSLAQSPCAVREMRCAPNTVARPCIHWRNCSSRLPDVCPGIQRQKNSTNSRPMSRRNMPAQRMLRCRSMRGSSVSICVRPIASPFSRCRSGGKPCWASCWIARKPWRAVAPVCWSSRICNGPTHQRWSCSIYTLRRRTGCRY